MITFPSRMSLWVYGADGREKSGWPHVLRIAALRNLSGPYKGHSVYLLFGRTSKVGKF